ncbi:hypothetical protein BDN70DRAFT_447622 [Pholiota conissans]|uniref:F-box domain-containing protein n=1 Tax=Pholiota conissans TaxID=109636 RepID=A0A9P6CU00_9AGAR|nr:hypothetical protein BDN70DRAFT_447622 [Pholiota conissans]
MCALPYDVLAEIVEMVDHDDLPPGRYKTLRTMSLTCHSMLHLCRKILFHEMILLPRDWDNIENDNEPDVQKCLNMLSSRPQMFRTKTVLRLVESNPEILQNVRVLSLYCDESNYSDIASHALLDKFHNIESLSIDAYTPLWFSQHSWNRLPSSYQLSLYRLINRSPLRSLSIYDYINIPLEILLCGCPTKLTLKGTFSARNMPTPPALIPLIRAPGPLWLEKLTLEGFPHAVIPLLDQCAGSKYSVIDPTALKSLSFKGGGDGICDYSALNVVSNLEQLSLEHHGREAPYYLSDIMLSLNSHSYATLSSLKIGITYHSSRNFGPLPASLISDHKFESLAALDIDLELHPNYQLQDAVLEDLSRLNKAIDGSTFPKLKFLTICIKHGKYWFRTEEQVEIWRSVPASHLSRISSEPSIDFEYHYT